MKTLQDLNDELMTAMHDGWIISPTIPTLDACEFEFEFASDAELGWNDPIEGFGIYLCCNYDRTQMDENGIIPQQERTFNILKKILTDFILSERTRTTPEWGTKETEIPYTLEFIETCHILNNGDAHNLINFSIQLKSYTYKS